MHINLLKLNYTCLVCTKTAFSLRKHVNSSAETKVNQDRSSGKIKGKTVFKGKKEIFTFEHLFVVGDSSGAPSVGLTSKGFSFF